jgi:DNA-binding Lrp family transcriptional regulator
VATFLEPPREIVEAFTSTSDKYSAIEGEILTLLRRPAVYPQSFKELRHELTPVFSESQIWQGIRNLLDDGLIRLVYTSGFEIGFEWA